MNLQNMRHQRVDLILAVSASIKSTRTDLTNFRGT